jgi:pimeloyl-ACP methyl ester carboxylesterase
MVVSATPRRFDLYYEEFGEGEPILLVPPAGATSATWGSVTEELARVGRVIAYDRRGYARSGGEPVHSMSKHTADAAALLEHVGAPRAVVVGTSAGAGIAVDLAVRRPDLVQVVVAHEFPWHIYKKHYGWRMAAFLLGAFSVTMVAAGLLVEFVFHGLASSAPAEMPR